MRIVKPYGRSHSEDGGAGTIRRVLRTRPPEHARQEHARHEIEDFARSHDKLVIAQWISAIDKIATKPTGENGPTNTQRAFRHRLGTAAWNHLKTKGLLPGPKDAGRWDYLEKLWRFKIEPYGSEAYKPRRDKRGEPLPEPSAKGRRWYRRFAGDVDVETADAAAIVTKIHEHLYEAEYRLDPKAKKRRTGRIAARARSIAGNVLEPPGPTTGANAPVGWSNADKEAYEAAGNVAGAIRKAAEERERARRRVTVDVAGAALYEHYALVFKADDGNPLSINEAESQHPGLFELHMAVKDCYARLLKHQRKDQKAHGEARRKVSTLLPATMEALFALVDNKTANRDLNALVRLGKVIHYEASGGEPDKPADVVAKWPADVTGSRYWTSDGQAEIKRNEAFVRVWRHVLALAARTLRDWADPEGEGDILLQIDKAVGERFDLDRCSRKLDLLFGNQATLFKGDGDADLQKKVLRLALEGTAKLRHASFHFRGLGGFAKALHAGGLETDAVRSALDALWKVDVDGRGERLRQTMEATHFALFFTGEQNRTLFAALADPAVATLPLPRFRRMLERTKNAWGKENLRLPPPANRDDLKNSARLCQYTALKLLYERPFRTWVTGRPPDTLNRYIDRAVERATRAAGDINAKREPDRRAVIVARAAGLGRLVDFSGLWERDLYFVTLALIHGLGRIPTDVFTATGIEKLREGQIVKALRNLNGSTDAQTVRSGLSRHFGEVWGSKNDIVNIRNSFAHFNMLQPQELKKGPVDLTACVNDGRRLMAYDRKLKNAVSQAVKELLHREGLELAWTMASTPPHTLTAAKMSTRQAHHLGKLKLSDKQGKNKWPITEKLHGEHFVRMAAALFVGTAVEQTDVADLDLDEVDWTRGIGRNEPRTEKKHGARPGKNR